MPSSPPSPFVLRALPTLPAEVLTAILEDPRLSKRDLSNCCLVNKHFTALAQPLLFRHLRLWCGHSAVSIDEEPGYVLHEDTKLLFRALRDLRNSHLCQYPRKLSVATYGADQEWIVNSDEEDDDSDIEEGDEDRGHYGFTGEFDDPSTPLKRALRLMPQVCSIDVGELAWASKLVRNVVFRHGQRWKEIEVDGCLLTEGADEREWSTLPSLQKVVCSELQRGGSPIRPLPRGLRTLNTPFVPPPIEDDSPPIESQLRVLSASLSVYTLLRIPAYRHLQFLYLWSIWGDSSISSPSALFPLYESFPFGSKKSPLACSLSWLPSSDIFHPHFYASSFPPTSHLTSLTLSSGAPGPSNLASSGSTRDTPLRALIRKNQTL